MKANKILLCLGLAICSINGFAQQDSTHRLKPLLIGTGVAYTGALIGLNQLWYSDFERESFHFFNDHREWKQMDKVGHFYAAFQLSSGGYRALRWANVTEDKSILWGTIFSAIVLTPIEVFDGFSTAYGASYSDVIANTAGASFFYLQQRKWGEIRIHPKFSFHRTSLPSSRPELLGEGLLEEVFKDYNGQTYWLSFDLSKLINCNFPKWLNLAVGYSANNMVAAHDSQSESRGFSPQRQVFFAIDFDLNEYKFHSKLLNTLIYLVNMVHLPAPTLEYSDKLKFHFAYY
ncbi:MAG: DUF2279 domain-containing protein [Fulvivirga sp.]